MIHPINIEADLLTSNPTRPSLHEAKRRPNITYHRDGRRMRDGTVMSTTTPASAWKNCFVRAFTHRLATSAITETAAAAGDDAAATETRSIDSFVDVVDLKPIELCNTTAAAIEAEAAASANAQHNRRGSALSITSSSDDEATAELNETRINSSPACDTRRHRSTNPGVAAAAAATIALAQPCCAQIGRSLKEFLRVDFANAQCISASARTPLMLTPKATSTRVWTHQNADGNRRSPTDGILFDLASIVSRAGKLTIHLDVHNTSKRRVGVQVVIHVHEETSETSSVAAAELSGLLHNDERKIECKVGKSKIEISLDVDEKTRQRFAEPNSRLVLTISGAVCPQ